MARKSLSLPMRRRCAVADRCETPGWWQQVGQQVACSCTTPANTPIGAGDALRVVAGVLQRLPGALEEDAAAAGPSVSASRGVKPKKAASKRSTSSSDARPPAT